MSETHQWVDDTTYNNIPNQVLVCAVCGERCVVEPQCETS